MWKQAVSMVTGGASGLGKATVERMVRGGGKVVIMDLPSSSGTQVAEDLGSENAIFVPTDTLKEEDISAAIQACKDKFGYMNVLVNCAGVEHVEMFYDRKTNIIHSLESFTKLVNVNVIGTYNTVKLVSLEMSINNQANKDFQRGIVINSINAGYEGQKGQIASAATKAAICGMTLPIARDMADFGIRICTIAPGIPSAPLFDALPETGKTELASNNPLPKRFDEFAKLVETIVFNPMLNAETIQIDDRLRL